MPNDKYTDVLHDMLRPCLTPILAQRQNLKSILILQNSNGYLEAELPDEIAITTIDQINTIRTNCLTVFLCHKLIL